MIKVCFREIPMRVLQVEDDPTAAQAVEQMLKSKGYACETTAYGEQAVALATHNDYDIILLDIMLPDIDGYEVLRRLQAAQVHTPVLIQSGLIGRDELEKGAGWFPTGRTGRALTGPWGRVSGLMCDGGPALFRELCGVSADVRFRADFGRSTPSSRHSGQGWECLKLSRSGHRAQ